MSKKKNRNKATKRQRQNVVRTAAPAGAPKAADPKPASDAPLPFTSIDVASLPAPTRTPPRATGPVPPLAATSSQTAAASQPTIDTELTEETPRFIVGATVLAVGGFLLASVVVSLFKGVPPPGTEVNFTTGATRSLIEIFGAIGLIGAFATLVLLLGWALMTSRRMAWLPLCGSLPLIAFGAAFVFGEGRLGQLVGGDIRVLGVVLGIVALAGAALFLAHAFGVTLRDLRRTKSDSNTAGDADAVRPMQRPAPVEAPARPVVERTRVEPVAIAAKSPTPVAAATAAASVVAPAPVAKPDVLPLSAAAVDAAKVDAEVRILKRGVPITKPDAIAVEPHEGEVNEPRPYTPPPKSQVAAAPAPVAPRREVSFVSVESGAVAAAVAAPASRQPLSNEATPFVPRAAAPATVEEEVDVEEDLDDEFEDVLEEDFDEEEEADEPVEAASKLGVEEAPADAVVGDYDDDDGWVADDDDDEEDEDEDEDEDDDDEDEDEEEEEEEEEEWVSDDAELRESPLVGSAAVEEELEEDLEEELEEELEEDELVEALEDDLEDDLEEELVGAPEEEPEPVTAAADEEPADADERATAPLGEATPVAELDATVEVARTEAAPLEAAAEEPVADEPETVIEPAPRAPRKRSRGKGGSRKAAPASEQQSLFEAAAPDAAPADGAVQEQLLLEAGDLFLAEGRVAVSMLQRRFGLDFKQSTAILDELQERGLIGPYLGGSRREILMDAAAWRDAVAARA